MAENRTNREYRRVQADRPESFQQKQNPVTRPKHRSTVPPTGPHVITEPNNAHFPPPDRVVGK